MGKKYKLRSETIVDIIETVPTEKVELLMKELTAVILQSKLSYDILKALDPTAKADVKKLVWDDDNKGEVSVTHSIFVGKSELKIMQTRNRKRTP